MEAIYVVERYGEYSEECGYIEFMHQKEVELFSPRWRGSSTGSVWLLFVPVFLRGVRLS